MKIHSDMAEALALVRAGQPMAATRLLQGLAPAPIPTPAATGAEAIDLVSERVAERVEPAAGLQLFRSPLGDIGYRLHKPAALAEGAPLLVMLHGCTQTSADFALGTRMNARAAEAGMAVLWPEQSTRSNARRCWRWFDAAHQRTESGEAALLLALVREVASDNALGMDGVFVAGLSAGGAMAAVLADCAPDYVKGVAVHSGLAAGAASTMPGGMAAMQRATAASRREGGFVPMMVLHGDADTVVSPGNADALFGGAVARAGAALTVAPATSGWGRLTVARDAGGHVRASRLMIAGMGHSWAGGNPAGSHTSAAGPDASAMIVQFFAEQMRNPPRI